MLGQALPRAMAACGCIVLAITVCSAMPRPSAQSAWSTRAVEVDSKDADYYVNRGNAFADSKDYDRAIADYNKAIELRPSYAHAYESRGSAYASKGVYTNAVADVTKATELARKKAPGPKTGAPKPPTKIAAKPAGAIKKTVENEAPDTWPTWAPFGAGKP